ncbi:hypothetical protein OG978_02870 [Streptomyces sp. NBC_01591]|nr:hypothetical protein OG978_02870 [Streptomyces sp. NBC_01591]
MTHSLRGRPLTSYEVLIQTISATRTRTGPTVKAALDENTYPTGRKLTRADRKAITERVTRDEFHGEWNYTITPHKLPDPHPSQHRRRSRPRRLSSSPTLS